MNNTTTPYDTRYKKPVVKRSRRGKVDASMILYFAFSTLFLYLGMAFAPGNEWQTAGLYTGGMLLWIACDRIFGVLAKKMEIALRRYENKYAGKDRLRRRNRAEVLFPPLYGLLLAAFGCVLLFPVAEFYSLTLIAGLMNGYLFYSCINRALNKRRTQVFLSRLHCDHYYDYHARRYRSLHLTYSGWDQLTQHVPLEKDPEMQFYFLN